MTNAITALSALAQEHRLRAFRHLVQAGPDGLAAGEIAERLGLAPAAVSFHLSQLFHAGLVLSQRQGRRVIYSANFESMRGLLAFLTEDCCDGRPEICGGLPAFAPSASKRGTRERKVG